MTHARLNKGRLLGHRLVLFLFGAIFTGLSGSFDSKAAPKQEIVPKWNRFERSFNSGIRYKRPYRECTLSVEFVSPRGQTHLVPAFWDGGSTWRLRFRPDHPGRWTYRTICSDPNNQSLDSQQGEFVCIAPVPGSCFDQHGPIEPAHHQRYFQHQDGTPFFWTADLANDAIRLATADEWNFYSRVRANQGFTAAQWKFPLKSDEKKESPFLDNNSAMPNPSFFQRLDRRIEALNRAGLLSAVELYASLSPKPGQLSDEAFATLVRYMMARWSAYDVAWILRLSKPDRDLQTGLETFRTAFKDSNAGPIVLSIPSGSQQLDLLPEGWIDALASGIGSEKGLPWKRHPYTPVLFNAPALENALTTKRTHITDTAVRKEIWEALLQIPAAGFTYGAAGVVDWNQNTGRDSELPVWKMSLFMPGAKQVSVVSELFKNLPFWKFQSQSQLQPVSSNLPPPAAAQTESKDFMLIYAAGNDAVQFPLKALPDVPVMTWINPRTGRSRSAVAVIGPRSIKMPTPDAQDWVLLVRNRKSD